MSTFKRPRTSRTAGPQSSSPGDPPASKRRKPSHVPEKPNGLAFLVDENKRAGKTVNAKLTNGVSRSNGVHLDESHAILAQNGVSDEESVEEQKPLSKVAPTQEIIDISSGEDESSVLEESDEEQTEAQTDANVQLQSGTDNPPLTNGHASDSLHDDVEEQADGGAEDAEMEDIEEPAEEVAEPASFGELLQARHPGPIDVRRTLQETDANSHALVTAPDDVMITSGHSLRTALSQALKNNDKDLLESCFAITNATTIRVTIQRLKSLEVATLLERIAERIFRSPGRTGPLMVWVQWALVDHGGYLANQPELMQKLKALTQVVRERASGLLPLLHLKGKLDLLCAQLEHRRGLQAHSRAINLENLDDDKDVLYVDGQDEDWSDSDDAMDGEKTKGRRLLEEFAQDSDSEDDMEQEIPNGIPHDMEEGSSADGEDDGNEEEEHDLLDIEAEEDSEGESAEEASSDEEAASEDDEDDDGSEIVVAAPKLSTLNRKR